QAVGRHGGQAAELDRGTGLGDGRTEVGDGFSPDLLQGHARLRRRGRLDPCTRQEAVDEGAHPGGTVDHEGQVLVDLVARVVAQVLGGEVGEAVDDAKRLLEVVRGDVG